MKFEIPKKKGEYMCSECVTDEGKDARVRVWEVWPGVYRMILCVTGSFPEAKIYDVKKDIVIEDEEWFKGQGLTEEEFRMKCGYARSIHVRSLMRLKSYAMQVSEEDKTYQSLKYEDGQITIVEMRIENPWILGGQSETLNETVLTYDETTGVIRGEMKCKFPGLVGWVEKQ